MSAETLEAFYEASFDAGVQTSPEIIERADKASADPHYGFIMEDNLVAATSLLLEGENSLPIQMTPQAVMVLAGLLKTSGESYRRASSFADPESDVWGQHVENVRNGKIVPLPEEFWMTVPRSMYQVKEADRTLNGASSAVEHILAALNYGIYFKPETMADAAKILATTPEEVAASKQLEAMPHLSVSNWAIAQVAQHVYQRMSATRKGSLHIVDLCSGTGATLAAITNRLALAHNGGHELGADRLSATGFEVTPGFYGQLKDDFLPAAQPYLKALEIAEVELADMSDFSDGLTAGKASLIEGGVIAGTRLLNAAELPKEDVLLASANYGFHRLPRSHKTEVMTHLGRAKNSIIVVGDLRQNGSRVNRGYFNFTNNGPLNAGNMYLENDLRDKGYLTFTIGKDRFDPDYVDISLRDRLTAQLDDDGFVTVAVKGPKAFKLLFGA